MTVTEDATSPPATKGDERVTEGALLRFIDELPQLWNVLKATCRPPRPHALAHDEYYGALIPTYAALPGQAGLTGHAQVNGFRGDPRHPLHERTGGADNSYIEEWSPALDL